MSEYIERSAVDYAQALLCELPQGAAWPREAGSNLMKLVDGLSQVWGDVSAATTLLMLIESDPRLTVEMLSDWEAAYGLPDPCVQTPQTIDQRRKALINRMTIQGSCQKSFFIAYAAMLGYTITIDEYVPFVFGLSSFGIGPWNAIMTPDSRYYWTVNIHSRTLTRFQFGVSNFGQNNFLDFTTADDLVCTINRWKPAHTIVIFNYVQD